MTRVPLRTRILDAIFRRAFWLALGLWAGCAHAQGPYTSEMAIGEWTGDWTGDGSASALRVTNPTSSPVHVVVACLADSGEVDRWDVDVAPQGSTTVLFQKLAKNWAVNVCHVESWVRR